MEALTALLIPIAAAGLTVWFILWIKRKRREAGHRDDENQPMGPDGF